MNKKFIAFYLPQFHVIPENDSWWGKGFTEWVRVKESKPVYEGHNQPRKPLEYYDLSDVNVMVNQAKLAKEFGLYGFCYYHYWFNGKLLLEKPLENMLACKEVDIPFCLSWANEKWTKAWEGKNKTVLMNQKYGEENDWEIHFKYLLPFFKDQRYIKIDGCPVFLIYRTESFDRFDEMIAYWNKRMVDFGLKELYIIETLNSYQKQPKCTNSKAVLEFEPMFTMMGYSSKAKKILNKIKRLLPVFFKPKHREYNYDEVWSKIINRNNSFEGKDIYYGAFPDWDNSPRFKNRAAIFKNVTPGKFKFYLKAQAKKSKNGFVFINAWNEWAEGAYLEPDKTNGYKFLESINWVVKSFKE